jgi:hypothetical protein
LRGGGIIALLIVALGRLGRLVGEDFRDAPLKVAQGLRASGQYEPAAERLGILQPPEIRERRRRRGCTTSSTSGGSSRKPRATACASDAFSQPTMSAA